MEDQGEDWSFAIANFLVCAEQYCVPAVVFQILLMHLVTGSVKSTAQNFHGNFSSINSLHGLQSKKGSSKRISSSP